MPPTASPAPSTPPLAINWTVIIYDAKNISRLSLIQNRKRYAESRYTIGRVSIMKINRKKFYNL